MIIVDNNYVIGGVTYRRTVSDTYLIRKVGTEEIYSEAVDLPTARWTYEETDLPLGEEGVGND